MNAIKARPYLTLGAIAGGLLAISLALEVWEPAWRWRNEPLHSTMEALGGLAAIAMAFVLIQRSRQPAGGRLPEMALGFLGMGLLEEFHAIAPHSNGAVLLRTIASVVGGLGFTLVWLPQSRNMVRRPWALWAVVSGGILFGLWALLSLPDQLPEMHRAGEFTAAAVIPKSFAGILFLAGAVRFLIDFRRSERLEDYLFGSLASLFGVAELMFAYSELWDIVWWFWHILRLVTYVLVLMYVSSQYLRMVEEAKLGEVARLLGDIGHDVKNLIMPVTVGAGLLKTEIDDLFRALPPVESGKVKASQKLCFEVVDLLGDATHRIEDRMREMADCVKGLSSTPQFAPCRIVEVVESVLKTLRILAGEKRIALRAEGLDSLPSIMADERRLYNAFYNLVNNAIPEVPAGGSITISGRVEPGTGGLVVAVADTGKGMPPEVRERLFTARAISLKEGGTGLGTKIVKDVIDAHGGTITVESQEGKGTAFFIRLPLIPPGDWSAAK